MSHQITGYNGERTYSMPESFKRKRVRIFSKIADNLKESNDIIKVVMGRELERKLSAFSNHPVSDKSIMEISSLVLAIEAAGLVSTYDILGVDSNLAEKLTSLQVEKEKTKKKLQEVYTSQVNPLKAELDDVKQRIHDTFMKLIEHVDNMEE